MAISKSTPYVRYKKDFTSSLHLGTIHIESEYLDRTQKTTIESIHGMTWHNKVVNENKELNLLSDTQLELTELEKQYWNTGEKRVSVDEIHTLEEVEPNEDGTYTYMVNSMEGEYIEIYDGINNITSTSDGLDGQFEIVYDTTEEDISGNIALDQVVSQYEITDSGVGTIIGAKSTGLTLVNHITESSKEEVVAIEQQEGQHFTINNTVKGNIKSAILKGNTLVNLVVNSSVEKIVGQSSLTEAIYDYIYQLENNKEYTVQFEISNFNATQPMTCSFDNGWNNIDSITVDKNGVYKTKFTTKGQNSTQIWFYWTNYTWEDGYSATVKNIVILEGDHTQEDIPYFEGMQSVKMPVLTTTGKNFMNSEMEIGNFHSNDGSLFDSATWQRSSDFIALKSNTQYQINDTKHGKWFLFYDKNKNFIGSIFARNGQFTTPHNCVFIKFAVETNDLSNKWQIELGNTITEYESYKTNILSTPEDLELRGIGNVKDELNLMTGELTQRIGEVVFDGITNSNVPLRYAGEWSTETVSTFQFTLSNSVTHLTEAKVITNHKIAALESEDFGIVIGRGGKGTVFVKVPKTIANINDFNNYLKINNITLSYVLEKPTIKTVDLTVQNQDDGTIPRIQTQQGITHVSTSSDGLSPVVEMSCSYDTIIKPNTTYTIKLDRPIVSDTMYLQVDLGGTMMMLDADVNAFTIKTPSTLSHSQLRLSGTGNTVKEIIVLEGNRVNDKIEYFEGMENVENPILVVSNCPYVFGKGGRI